MKSKLSGAALQAALGVLAYSAAKPNKARSLAAATQAAVRAVAIQSLVAKSVHTC